MGGLQSKSSRKRYASDGWPGYAPPQRGKSSKKRRAYDDAHHTWPWGPPPGAGYPFPQAAPAPYLPPGFQPVAQPPWPPQPYYPYATMPGYPHMPPQMQQMQQPQPQPLIYQQVAQVQQPNGQRPLFAPFQPTEQHTVPVAPSAPPAPAAAPAAPPPAVQAPVIPQPQSPESEPESPVPPPTPMPAEPPPRVPTARPPSARPPSVHPPTPQPPPAPPVSDPTPPPFGEGQPRPAWYGPPGPAPRTPLMNPLPEPPRDIYELEPYKSLIARSFLSQVLTASHVTEEGHTSLAVPTVPAAPVVTAPAVVPQSEPRKKSGGFFSSLTRGASKRKQKEREREQQRAKKRTEIPIAWRFIQPTAQGVVGVPPSVQAVGGSGTPAPMNGFMPGGTPGSLAPHSGTPGPAAAPMPFAGAGPSGPTAPRSPRMSSPLLSPLGVLPGPLASEPGGRRAPPVAFSTHTYPHLSGFMLHSPHEIVYKGGTYPTALHLLEAHKFMRDSSPELAALAERVRLCENVREVLDFVHGAREWVRGDWDEVVVDKAEEVLYLKFRQHPVLCGLLIGTADAELIYSEPNDPFWGGGETGGQNWLGRVLMRVRDRILSEGPQPAMEF